MSCQPICDLHLPPAYKRVRAQPLNSVATGTLPGLAGIRRVVTNTPRGLAGFEISNDERQYMVANFHIPALGCNVSASVRKMDPAHTELICTSCEERHTFTGNEPVSIVITDQHFPPVLPSGSGFCTVILRCEDAMLHELPGLLREFFPTGSKGKVSLPEGSLVIYGALSHLAARGVENYAEEVVRTRRVLTGMLGSAINLAHSIFVPLGGLCSAGLIRMMVDLDSWLNSNSSDISFSLIKAREALWNILLEGVDLTDSSASGERIYFLPEHSNSAKKMPFSAGELAGGLPKTLPPLSQEKEEKIIRFWIAEKTMFSASIWTRSRSKTAPRERKLHPAPEGNMLRLGRRM
jgi:hypothetical protein